MFPQYGAKSGSGMLISTSVEGLVAPRKSAKRDAGPQPAVGRVSGVGGGALGCRGGLLLDGHRLDVRLG